MSSCKNPSAFEVRYLYDGIEMKEAIKACSAASAKSILKKRYLESSQLAFKYHKDRKKLAWEKKNLVKNLSANKL